jgi:hypothetical protein
MPLLADPECMLMTGSGTIDAERAFARAVRERRRAALAHRLRGRPHEDDLDVSDERTMRVLTGGTARVREIPVAAITATVEPSRAALFDRHFRPAAAAGERWRRVWLAEQRGAVLPPISVIRVGGSYAVRDGHHRVSVARARGAVTIDATVDGVQLPSRDDGEARLRPRLVEQPGRPEAGARAA